MNSIRSSACCMERFRCNNERAETLRKSLECTESGCPLLRYAALLRSRSFGSGGSRAPILELGAVLSGKDASHSPRLLARVRNNSRLHARLKVPPLLSPSQFSQAKQRIAFENGEVVRQARL